MSVGKKSTEQLITDENSVKNDRKKHDFENLKNIKPGSPLYRLFSHVVQETKKSHPTETNSDISTRPHGRCGHDRGCHGRGGHDRCHDRGGCHGRMSLKR